MYHLAPSTLWLFTTVIYKNIFLLILNPFLTTLAIWLWISTVGSVVASDFHNVGLGSGDIVRMGARDFILKLHLHGKKTSFMHIIFIWVGVMEIMGNRLLKFTNNIVIGHPISQICERCSHFPRLPECFWTSWLSYIFFKTKVTSFMYLLF